jgi:hypothetical protein
MGVDVDVCEQVPFRVITTVWLVVDPVIPEHVPVKPETSVKTGDAGALKGKTTVMVEFVVNVPLDDDVKPMVQVVLPLPATSDDGEKVTFEGVIEEVGVITLAGEAEPVSADVVNVKFDTVYALNDDGLVRFPIENVAGIWSPREQFPANVTVIELSATFVTSVPVHAPAIPVSAVNVVDPGRVTLEGNATVMVEPVVRAPDEDDVKPIVHDVATLSTVVAAVKVTLVGAASAVSDETDAGLIADAESEDVDREKFDARYEESLIDDGFMIGEISKVPSLPTPSEQGPLSDPCGCRESSCRVIVTV